MSSLCEHCGKQWQYHLLTSVRLACEDIQRRAVAEVRRLEQQSTPTHPNNDLISRAAGEQLADDYAQRAVMYGLAHPVTIAARTKLLRRLQLPSHPLHPDSARLEELKAATVNDVGLDDGRWQRNFAAPVEEWLAANQKADADVMWGRFPLGMVLMWMERAKKAEKVHRIAQELTPVVVTAVAEAASFAKMDGWEDAALIEQGADLLSRLAASTPPRGGAE